jgi:hydrogenase nickel incorporation protein HypB
MCTSCGCGSDAATITNMQTGRRHDLGAHEHVRPDGSRFSHSHHDHAHHGDQGHHHGGGEVIELNARILAKNDQAAARNRAWFQGRNIVALNLMSAPGAGKTTLLERSIAALKRERTLYVLEGDQATNHDAERVKAAGALAAQINTGQGCHLDAEMVARGMSELNPEARALLFIENVGNLVCPALFDLGETRRVAILSVTEGDDKPLKYPHMFRAADLLLLNKIDLLPYVDFDMDRAIGYARQVNPGIMAMAVSARTGEGMAQWLSWVEAAPVRAVGA